MIKANELRIGDKVINPTNEEWVTVLPYLLNKSMIDDNNSNYIPIHLTPEILERCGFVYVSIYGCGILSIGDFQIGYDGEDFRLNQFSLRYKRSIFFKVKYLHHLQNLIFDLSGKELEFKPQPAIIHSQS